jgi:CRISPR-associated protein Csy1
LRFEGPPSFDGSRRLRVGFVASIFRDCTAGRYFERWITALDARRFDARAYYTGPIADALTRRIEAASRFSHLRAPAREVAARLLADELDLIVYPEVGMDAMTYVLSALRLAPVQCAAWGHPVTTGSEAIDYFLTCGAMEPADASSQYTEKLVRLPGIGVDYAMPERPETPSRGSLRLPEGKRIYACAQSLFKVHPEMDSLFAELLRRDTEAVLVFFQAPAPAVTRRFAARLERALAARGVAPRGQVKFLPRAGSLGFRGVLAACDVVLDTTRWSGGNTSLDAFAAGVPVVTQPGRFMRGRQTAAMLQAMELEMLVCADHAAYLETALRAAGDARWNAQLRGAIAERRGALFGQRVQPAFEEALLAMAARAA